MMSEQVMLLALVGIVVVIAGGWWLWRWAKRDVEKAEEDLNKTFNVGVTPAGMALTRKGDQLFVANNNNYGAQQVGAHGGSAVASDSVTVIETRRHGGKVKKTITDPSFNQPYTVTRSDDGRTMYVTNSNGSTISIIDVKTSAVTGTIAGFDGPSGLAILPDTDVGYVNNYGGPDGLGSGNGTTVTVVDLKTKAITASIEVGLAPAALAASRNGKFVYSINYVDGNPGTGSMSVIDTKTQTVVATISGFTGPFAVALSRNGKRAYVTNFGSNNFSPVGTTLSVVDLEKRAIVATIPLGLQPSGVAVSPDDRFVYASIYSTLYAGSGFTSLTAGQGTVVKIDARRNEVVGRSIAVGQSPSAIVASPCGRKIYVSNFTSNTVNEVAVCAF